MVSKNLLHPDFKSPAGFSNLQFKKLDGLYLRAAAAKVLNYRSVSCDFEEGVASYTYYTAESHPPLLQFLIRRVGPRAVMYEIYAAGRGRILKSGLFERAYEKLEAEILAVLGED